MPLFLNRSFPYVNLKDYCKIDGVTDDSTGFTTAYTLASSLGVGLWHPGGTLIKGNDTLLPGVSIDGCGIGISIIKLKNGANTDLFSAQTSSINLSAAANSGIVGTLNNFTLQDLTLDGNKANQTSGTSYPLRFYGYNFILRDLEVLNGYTGGGLIDWNGGGLLSSPSDQMESYIDTCKFHDNNGIGIQMGGPHDSRMHNVVSFANGSHNFHFAPNSTGMLVTNAHSYFSPNVAGVCSYLVEASTSFTNCVAEGSYHCDVAMLAGNISWIGGSIFGTPTENATEVGIQIGQIAGQTPFPGQVFQSAGVTTTSPVGGCVINTTITECHGGALNCVNEGNNIIIANIYQTSGTALVGNAINKNSDSFILNVQGLTGDGTLGKSGGTNMVANGSTYAFTVTDLTNGTVFTVDSYGNINTPGALNTGGGVLYTSSTTGAALATNGTINTQGLANSTVIPTADVTGVILQAGYPGELCLVHNASNFTITMAASGTSHVANGALCKIPANTASYFFYDNTNSLWYSCGVVPLPIQSATAVTIATSGTITTTDLDTSRVAPTAAVTGVILQAGTYGGQTVTVQNESAFSVTFATAATSNVADGTSDVIAANNARLFKWSTGTSRWYPCK